MTKHILLGVSLILQMAHHSLDKEFVDYAQYEAFTKSRIWCVTRLKVDAPYKARQEYDISDDNRRTQN